MGAFLFWAVLAVVDPFANAAALLYGAAVPPDCGGVVRCLVATRYPRGDAQSLALALFDETGDLPGLEREHDMDGGYRKTIHIVPELPNARQLGWILGARRRLEAFVTRAGRDHTVAYRHKPLSWRFFRSVARRTPSAYARDWTISWNVAGSLNGSAASVETTIVHELFHLNDQEHDRWSRRILGELVDDIVARCGTARRCLAPFAPMPTTVRGGTYYAFQPDNGDIANEYAAELATRYYLEQQAAAHGERYGAPPFKCQTPANGRAWSAFAAEFFGGYDLVPSCGPAR